MIMIIIIVIIIIITVLDAAGAEVLVLAPPVPPAGLRDPAAALRYSSRWLFAICFIVCVFMYIGFVDLSLLIYCCVYDVLFV